MPRFDAVTFGEGLLRLSAPRYERLEQASLFDVHAMGAGLETAAALSRLGLQVLWLTAVGDTPLGRKIVNKAREHGVEVSHVQWVPDGRTGLCFAEPGSAPRPDRFFYDAQHTAFRATPPHALPWSVLQDARLCHLDAAALAGHPAMLEAAHAAAARAGCRLSVCLDDPPDRPLRPDVFPRLRAVVDGAAVVIVTRRAAETVFGLQGPPEDLAPALRSKGVGEVVAAVEGRRPTPRTGVWQGAAAGETVYRDRAYTMEVIDAGGVLSAFAAGFLYGYLTEGPGPGLQYGNAAAALMHSVPGHLSWFTPQDLRAQAQGAGATLQR